MSNLSLNKAIISGRPTGTPELKQTPQGVFVTTFTVAINRKGKQSEADFINCIAWRRNAEFICRYFVKGSGICVVGPIQTRSWEDRKGNKRYATEVITDEVYFVDGKTDSGGGDLTTEAIASADITDKMADLEELSSDDDLLF